jgi:hypothetical protein
MGRREAALTSFERSLALRPQNPSLKEAVRTLKGESASAGTQHLVDVKDVVKDADGYTNEDAVILVDNTYVRVQRNGGVGPPAPARGEGAQHARPGRVPQLPHHLLAGPAGGARGARPGDEGGRLGGGRLRRERPPHQRALDGHVL